MLRHFWTYHPLKSIPVGLVIAAGATLIVLMYPVFSYRGYPGIRGHSPIMR